MAGKQMQLEDWLDDLCVRFIINLPQEDLSSVARICFQVEEAQWFYEDFIRPLDASLPSMTLRTFCLRIFQHCPLLANFSVENHTKAFEEFLEYKTRVPVRGAILLNHAMDSAVLVRGWKKGASWSFPRGKINKDEDDLDCAVREVWEETGFDLRAAGLVPTEAKPKYIEIPIKQQQLRLYIFRNVPMDTNFQPQTRKEISKIQWYKLSELPAFRKKGAQGNESEAVTGAQANKFYMVAPFLVPLKKWVSAQKKLDEKKAASERSLHPHSHAAIEEVPTDDDAWHHQEQRSPYEVPAIETLDGATQELQRLLKVQPPTQGLQPPVQQAQNDKGSALLSILQAKNSGYPQHAQPTHASAHVPHTPLEHTMVEAPQPQNPHHLHAGHQGIHVNTHQPPPHFGLPQGQPSQWNYPQNYNPGNQLHMQGFHGGAQQQQHYGRNQAHLMHPQPLPPQVQRSVLTQKIMQENAKAGFPGGVGGVAQGQPPNMQARPNQATAHTMPQGHAPQQMPGQVQLNGQSMALLSAFKRDVPALVVPQHAHNRPVVEVPGFVHGGQQIPYGQQAPHQPAAGASFEHQKSPTELAGSGVAPPTEQHRTALLDMFKKGPASPNTLRTPVVGAGKPELVSPAEKEILSQFSAQNYNSSAPAQATGPGQTHVDVANVAMSQLSIHHRQAPTNEPPFNIAQLATSPQTSNPVPAQQHQQQQHQQPIRILQRPQDHKPFSTSEQPPVHARATPQSYRGSPAPNRPGEPPSDQKRQLLSLFGKQPGSPSAAAPEPATGGPEGPRSRVASLASNRAASGSRMGRQTPISAEDQSFLLGYLQSVTNNASR